MPTASVALIAAASSVAALCAAAFCAAFASGVGCAGRLRSRVLPVGRTAIGYPFGSISGNRVLEAKLSLQDKTNICFDELCQPVLDLHEGMEENYRSMPMRFLKAEFVAAADALPCYEALPADAYIELPYSETAQEEWNAAAAVSWRWSLPKPASLAMGFSPMSELQLEQLKRFLRADRSVSYVWVDWCCVPQFTGSPMLEVARSKLFYSRARTMVVVPGMKELPEGNIRVVLSNVLRALARGVPGQHSEEAEELAGAALQAVRDRGIYGDFGYFGRVWTLAERMARHGRGERLQNWLSLETWVGMTLDALWVASDSESDQFKPGLQFYWGRLFDPQKARATIETLRLVRHRGSNLASDSLDTELAQLFVDAVLIWKNGSVTEALDVEWLANYLRFEAGVMYESWFFEDAIWAIYSFFCWHLREDFWEAHQDLCLLAGINESESRLISMAERAPSENCRTSQFVSTRASHLTSSRFSRSIRNSASRLSEAE